MSAEHVIVSTTTAGEAAARALAESAIGARLGACAQIVGPMISVYRWDGDVATDREWRVEVKTAADRVDELIAMLKAAHSYEVPEIIVTPIVGGSEAYLGWLGQETRPA